MQIEQQIRDFVTTNFYIPPNVQLDERTSFLETGILDSTGVLDLVVFLENHFGIAIGDDELVPANFGTLGALTTFVESKRGRS